MKVFIPGLCLLIAAQTAFPCTTFLIDKDGKLVFGRNYDWVSGVGIVHVNQRGLFKTSIQRRDGKTISWVSRFGSISFNQFGKEVPNGGMNEKGLVVEVMWLQETQYPGKDARPSINELEWVQFQLDNAATVEEVLNSNPALRINGKGAPIHYLVADAKGNAATIEFLKGKMVVHKNMELPFPVLTNNTYASSVNAENNFLHGKAGKLPGNNSLYRFVKACSMIQRFKLEKQGMPVTDFAFSILDSVSQGDFTKWSIVYDISNREIHFKTQSNKDIKTVRLDGFDFSCTSIPKMFNMNQQGKGDIIPLFRPPDPALMRNLTEQAVRETNSAEMFIISNEDKKLLLRKETAKCK